MRLISWNVGGRVVKLEEQLKAIQECKPAIVALQEVTERTVGKWHDGLQEIGLSFVIDNVPNPRRFREYQGRRKYGELVASNLNKLTMLPPFPILWPEECFL